MISHEDREALQWGKHLIRKLEKKWLRPESKDVTWQDFEIYEIGKEYKVGDLLLIIQSRNDNEMVIYCEMPQDSLLPSHMHSTHIESFVCLSGLMKDTEKPYDWQLAQGDRYVYQKNEVHEPYAEEFTKLLITAKR